MSHAFFLASTGAGAGLTTVSLGLVRALDRLGIRTSFYKPFAQLHEGDQGPERSTLLIEHMTGIKPPHPISLRRAESLLGAGKLGLLMEEVVALYRQSARHADVVIIEGLVADNHAGYATRLNVAVSKALDAEVILVAKPEPDMEEYIDISANAFSDDNGTALIGTILNKVGMPNDKQPTLLMADGLQSDTAQPIPLESELLPIDAIQATDKVHKNHFSQHPMCQTLSSKPFHFIGAIPWQHPLTALRMCDVAAYLDAEILNEGYLQERRVERMELCARTLVNTLSVYQPHTLLIFPGDRDDVFVAACMSAMNGVRLAGILLTGGFKPHPRIMALCHQAIQTGLPLLLVEGTSFNTAAKLINMPPEVAVDDLDLINKGMDHVADHLDADWLKARCAIERKPRLSPAAFRYQLIQQASKTKRRIVLPEGEEPRTIMAAYQCQQRGIADCILLGDPERIHQVAASQGISLDDVRIINKADVIEDYIEPMVALRQHKGMTRTIAKDQLQSRIALGTMMLALDDVDGLVAGALHSTANTVRPAFQLIGTSASAELVSSIFFMCLPDQVVVYGDCAINPDPNAEQLADIAIQSADSASRFGLDSRVAMISYSTGESGTGLDVDKVRQATKIVRQRRPDLLVDGPLQYDAAAITSVGKSKAPDSKVAGKANVFIFPDLNTGNTTYKAVQRSASVVSIGPMLQGLRKPVNDLSRGATVEDIVYTIALTAIQAG
ncbi:phosphate acetyltransferase [Mariprofundus sp. EBB-1]|uniref:phosphate acetyltransferase n=1 Tax=Mariprofundus sp. EBB-1 TaxID=2650971 RepID=UPI000EF254F9|nr:phosphate acetyltransferase [Mariprofundus sp. EBB-1]RLL49451.1 phosphate acetyltransferase [Mariprofundus sp. EBB-1]